MMQRATPAFLILSGFSLVTLSPLKAQEVGAFFTAASSDHVELPGPVGFGASALMELAPEWLVRLSYHRTSEETQKEGVVCRNYSA
ncbi:hypothetical protein ACFL3S_01870, partial [Gemmatimonadota bacterium]